MIKRIKWKDHPILGNLELDFTKNGGNKIYNTIVLIGENGTGKTTILDTLSTFLNLKSFEFFDYIEYKIEDNEFKIYYDDSMKDYIKHGFHLRQKIGSDESPKRVNSGSGSNLNSIDSDLDDIRHYGCIYSKAKSGFNTDKVTSTSNSKLDTDKYDDDNLNNYTKTKQLLIDIETEDDNEYRKLCKEKGPIPTQKFDLESKANRFRNAFNGFFNNNPSYEGLNRDSKQEINVEFRKFGKKINIDELSTGEKQIVFRGACILRNIKNIDGGIILLDEPELSMHPRWQLKILDFYRRLLNDNDVQKTQLIVTTHSNFVVENAINDIENVLIISLKNNNGSISMNRLNFTNVLPQITTAEINYSVFGVSTNDFHILLYGYLQELIGKTKHIRDTDNYIKNSPLFENDKHMKIYEFEHLKYWTLPTYIRNTIDHPSQIHKFNNEELAMSIELLIKLIQNIKEN